MASSEWFQADTVRVEHLDGAIASAMVAASPECVKILDAQGRLRFMSDNGLSLMQIPEFAAVDGATWWDLWPEVARPVLRRAVAAANEGLSTSFEAACPTAAGVHKHWRVRVSQVKGGDLDQMILASSEDISEIVEARATRVRLDRDNEALRRFTHLVAHDLRNPIRHLRLLSEAVIEDAADGIEVSAQLDVLRQIGREAGTLVELLDGLEALHQFDAVPLELESMSIRTAIDTARSLVAIDPAALDLDVAGDATLEAHSGMLVSMFRNLLENSLKYGGDRCRVQVSILDRQGGSAEVVVRDNGPGFPEDRRDEVFEPLVRQSNGVGIPGAGIGLALVKNVMGRHGGQVRLLENHADQSGAALQLKFPANDARSA